MPDLMSELKRAALYEAGTPQPAPDAMRTLIARAVCCPQGCQYEGDSEDGSKCYCDTSDYHNSGIERRTKAVLAVLAAPVPSPDGAGEMQIRKNYAASAVLVCIALADEVVCAKGTAQDVAASLRDRFASATGAAEPVTHTRSCGYFEGACTCCLEERKALATEQTMHRAWRKRAEEAEEKLATTTVRGDREARRLLQELEEACNKLAETRPQAAYDAMIAGGQKDLLYELDQARRAAITFLSLSVQPGERAHYHCPSTMHMGDCSICGNIGDHPLHIGSPSFAAPVRK